MYKKDGRLLKTDIKFIQDNCATMTVDQLAQKLNRHPDIIRKYISTPPIKIDKPVKEIKSDLKKSFEWAQIEKELLDDEKEYFLQRWATITHQFGDDILATENMQIFLTIKYEILMSRNLKEKKNVMEDILRVRKELDEAVKTVNTQRQSQLDAILSTLQARQQELSKEFDKQSDSQANLLKALKATREQRIARIESQREKFIDLLKDMEKQEFREAEGQQLAKAKLARDNEYKRLGEYHQYINNEIDRPILSAETVQ